MTNQKTDYFKAFCTISKALGTTLKKDELLQLIVANAIEAMEGKAACLYLEDERAGLFQPAYSQGLSESYLHAAPMKARQVVDNILKEGGYLSIYDATKDTNLENLEAKKAEGIASILVVPVMVRGKAIGVLSLYTSTPKDFSEDEIAFLGSLAEQGGMAISNARLFERINQNARLFLDLASSINSSLDIKQILHILSSEIGETMGMKGVSIRLYNKDTDTMDLITSYGLSQAFLDKGPISITSTVVKQLFEGRIVTSQDVPNDERFHYREEAQKEGIVSMICTPIMSKKDVIGEMRLFADYEMNLAADELMMIKALAHQGALAIQNASVFLQLQEAKENLEKDIWVHKQWF
ncbi:GAF domain-containing protein [Desulfobacterales bacterium HSG16]|nr:GAF domain-containing protein [Desulfobacterales bacterium HSG16]